METAQINRKALDELSDKLQKLLLDNEMLVEALSDKEDMSEYEYGMFNDAHSNMTGLSELSMILSRVFN